MIRHFRVAAMHAAWATLALLGLAGVCIARDETPVIFIPAITGSVLTQKSNGEIAWGELAATNRNLGNTIWPIGQDEDARFDAPRILRKFSGYVFGGQRGYLEFDDKLKAIFKPRNFRDPRRYFPFPYDWRYSNLKTACQLRDRLNASGTKPFEDPGLAGRARRDGVIIVAHSMGGIIANLFAHFYAPEGTLETAENPCPHQYKVRMIITIGTPHLGAATALRWMVDKPADWLMKNFKDVPEEQKRRLVYSVPAIWELMPSYAGCCLQREEGVVPNPDVEDSLSIETWQRLGWLPAEVAADPSWIAHVHKALEKAKLIRKIMAIPLPSDVAVVNIAGLGTETATTIFAGKQFSNSAQGDDTVPAASADPGFPYPTNVRGRSARSDHMGLVDDANVQRFLVKAIGLVGRPLVELEAGIKDVGLPSTPVETLDGTEQAQLMNLRYSSSTLAPNSLTQVTFSAEKEVPRPDGTAVLERIANIDPDRIKVEIEFNDAIRVSHSPVEALSNGTYSVVFSAPPSPGTITLKVTLPGGLNRSAVFVVAS